jgi:hypothetical protein
MCFLFFLLRTFLFRETRKSKIKNMKTYAKLAAITLSIAAFAPSLFAQLNIPSDGSDGALVISSNTVIDLSQALTGNWTNNNAANAGKGIYDPSKWAVVFKYSSVVISNGATLTFSNHPTHAPVVWLVTNNVTINGVLSLDSQPGGAISYDNVNLLEPGPGGFRGGARSQSGLGHGSGFGPGGSHDAFGGNYAYGSYGTGYLPYGNPQIVPLIGGSGGGGWDGDGNVNGGSGGGAILIAASGSITVGASGTISADSLNNHNGYPGSGGAVRLVANQIVGNGRIEAISAAYVGRIRLEANTVSGALSLNPPTVAVSPTPLIIWPDTNVPTVKIVSVASLSAPSDPKAAMAASGDDLTIAKNDAVAIVLQTANFPTNGLVNVYIKPRNSPQSTLTASFVSGTTNLATWQLTTILPVSHTVIQARAISN